MSLPPVKIPHPHVEINAAGRPHIVGTPVPVRRIWGWHRRGVAVDTLLKRYPTLTPAEVLSALAFAYDNPELIAADLAIENAEIDSLPR